MKNRTTGVNPYGVAAVEATALARDVSPAIGWQRAVERTFPNSKSQQVKSCPRGAFLGLCEAGLIKGIPSGSYTRSQLNKQYAVRGVTLLRQRPELVDDALVLWRDIVGIEKAHNGQMDVVLGLWTAGLIRTE